MHVMGHDHIRVRALRAVAKTLASLSPRCFGGRVARRRLGSRRNFDQRKFVAFMNFPQSLDEYIARSRRVEQ